MKGTITEIGLLDTSPRHGEPYQPIYLKMEDGKSARTYLSPSNRNYNQWKKVMKVGTEISGLRWKNEFSRLIDADSNPITVQ